MSQPKPSDDEAYKRLAARADALEQSTARAPAAAGGEAANKAYQILALLLGGAFVGLALGFGVDRLTGGRTAPGGLIVGLLLGFGAAIFLAKRTADRLMAQAASESARTPTAPAVVRYDDEED